jgi:creatinine amidohydrolase
MSRRLDHLAWPEVEAAIRRGAPVLVPVGAVEPHGRHCPVGADNFIALEIAERLAARADALVFPPIPFGTLEVIYDFRSLPGSISIDSRLLLDIYTNVGAELGRQGFRRLVFVNGHGPNSPVLQLAQYRIRDQAAVEVGILEWWAAGARAIHALKGFDFGNHADEIETSILMATAGGGPLVDLDKAVVNSRTLEGLAPAESQCYRQKVPFTRTWDERWVGTSGNMGDPTRASAEKGEQIIAAAVDLGLVLLQALAEQPTKGQSSTDRR